MAVTSVLAEAPIERVKREISSTATTSPATLNLLRALLGLDLVHDGCKAQLSSARKTVSRISKRSVPTSFKQQPKRPNGRAGADFAIYESNLMTTSSLPDDAKRRLATETFNITLKSLSDAAKWSSAQHDVGRPVQFQDKTPQTPLQNCSPNRKALPNSNCKAARTLKAPPTETPLDLEATADCATSALEYLRFVEDNESIIQTGGEGDWRLERGALIMLDKLTTLKLKRHASKQVCQSKAQIRKRVKNSNDTQKPLSQERSQRVDDGKPLSDALLMDVDCEDKNLLSLITSFQSQALRVALLYGRSTIDDGMVAAMRPAQAAGPPGTILKAVKKGLLFAEQGSQQLRILSQALMTLCASVNEVGQDLVTPQQIFELRGTALEIRCIALKLFPRETEVQYDVWIHFGRALSRYREECKIAGKEDYRLVKIVLQSLQRATGLVETNEKLPPSVTSVLADMAQRAGAESDSLSLLESLCHGSEADTSVSRLLCRCRIAASRLQSWKDDRQASLASAEQALGLLKGPLKGSTSEMTDLLLFGARLRKAAMAVIAEVEEFMTKGPITQIDISIQICATRIVYAFLQFVLRYLGSSSCVQSDLRGSRERSDRGEALASVGYKTVDAVLTIVKRDNAWRAVLSAETDAALQKCAAIAVLLEEQSDNSGVRGKSDPVQPSLVVRISNAYWSRYVKPKAAALSNQESCLLLERATELLANRDLFDQEQGSLALRYSNLSSIYIDMKCFEKAKQAQRSAIALLIKLGALAEAVEISLSRSSRYTWSDPSSKCGMLGKALSDFVAVSATRTMVAGCEDFMYDDTSLPASHQAALLEKQIFTCIDTLPSHAMPQVLAASRKVLDLYSSPSFQVCRLRFAYSLLTASSKNEKFPATEILSDTIDTITHIEIADAPTKIFLASFRTSLHACVRLHWLLQTSALDVEALDSVLVELNANLSKCSDSVTLDDFIDDPQTISKQLQSVADYAGMLNLRSVKLKSLQALRQVLEHRTSKSNPELVLCHISIGAVQTQIGNTVDAGRSFATAEQYLSRPEVTALTIMQWELHYAEYLLRISNTKKCAEILRSAGVKYDLELCQSQELPTRPKFRLNALLAHGAFVASKWAFDRGDLKAAVLWGRQCIKLSNGIWMSLERLWDTVETSDASVPEEHSLQYLTEGVSNLSFSIDRSLVRSIPRGAPFWQHVELHFRALIHVSSLCAHCGLYQDSIYYAEQASKIGRSTCSDVLTAEAQSALSILYARACHPDQAKKSLKSLESLIPNVIGAIEICHIRINQATSYMALGDLNGAREHLTQVEDALATVERDPSVDAILVAEQEQTLANEMANLNIATAKNLRTARKTQAQPPNRGSREAKPSTIRAAKLAAASSTGDMQRLSRKNEISNSIAMLKSHISFLSGNLTTAASELSACNRSATNIHSAQYRFLEASVMLAQALEMLAVDAVHCVLSETTIALPSRYRRSSVDEYKLEQQDLLCLASTTKGRKTSAKPPQKKVNVQVAVPQSQVLLNKACTLLLEASQRQIFNTPSDIVHQVYRTLSQLTLLTSAISMGLSYSPATFFFRSLLPNDLVREREFWTMDAEIATVERTQVQKWPAVSSGQYKVADLTSSNLTLVGQREMTSYLPSSWTLLSLSLSADKSDLLVSRATAENEPFVLCIPLLRSSAEDLNETQFSFYDAKQELIDVISQANLTAHDARGQAEKGARKIWWAEREALDQRLEALLKNIENIWLGGFRGVMAPTRVCQSLLARFAESLCQSLDKHLPSRQKVGAKSKTNLQLHPDVIELFLTLGNPDEVELDDCIADLLYFVIDILQFSGERNAYDEIDFDIITVEVLDALRSYHEVCLPNNDRGQHTILILDKELHAFPWESLPCLSGQSISRMSSMRELSDRLKSIREQNPDEQCLSIPSDSGSYILNPSSDLTSTQETFESTFESQLPEFSSIVNRAPTEKEFESGLRDNTLLLYFGHGSGAQYIRGRTIKKLQHCAVTFLMGCSSSKMVECGVYEPYGVPWNYMFAGAPAVVGTLWDVTDKDIDRFAMKTFTKWGLLDADRIEDARKGKEKVGKGKKKGGAREVAPTPPDHGTGRMALDEAVAKARDSCVLRYLNGAAPVIYGVPVALDKRL